MANEEAKLFVAGLPDSISEDVLKQLFEATGGKVVSVSLPKDRMTGRPRGFGFVTLSTPQEAQAARDALDGSMQAGKSISVRPFQAEPPRRDSIGPGAARPGPPGPRLASGGGAAREGYRLNRRIERSTSATCRTTRPKKKCSAHQWSVAGRRRSRPPSDGRRRAEARLRLRDDGQCRGRENGGRRASFGGFARAPLGRQPGSSQGGTPCATRRRRRVFGAISPAFGGGGGGAPSASSGPAHRKPGHEEKRKRSFEDGGGPRKKRGEKDDQRGGGGANRVDYSEEKEDE